MLVTKLQKLLTAPKTKTSNNQEIFWLSLSLTFSLIYALLALQEAFSGKYVVQDDVRQHVFWMVRFLDPQLFPNDWIADYFQSVAPDGYTFVYWLPAKLGINPLLLNKFLPMVLGLITTGYCFGISMQLLPVPATGFMATLLLNENLWFKDDIVSATPRGFAYPIFIAFLYYVLRRNLLGVCVAIALLGLFYPQLVFIAAGILILRLLRWQGWRPRLSQNRTDFILCAVGLGVAFLVLLPFALSTSKYGPTITASEAKKLPEFLPGGRSRFFDEDTLKFYMNGSRSGMFPKSLFTPITLCIGLVLPVLLQFTSRFPLVKQIAQIAILPQILLASVGMFFAAHAALFKLHLPSRYTGTTFRIVIALATAIALSVILDAILRWATEQSSKRAEEQKFRIPKQAKIIAALGITLVLSITLIGYPSFVENFPKTSYRVGKAATLYEFFQKTPKDTFIASLSDEVNNIPTFSQRSILVGSEYAIPYHVGYYREFRQRTINLIRAQYSPNLAELKKFIQEYGIDYWLLDADALTREYLANNRWIKQYQPVTKEALDKLQQGAAPALSNLVGKCTVFKDKNFFVLQADCITKLTQ